MAEQTPQRTAPAAPSAPGAPAAPATGQAPAAQGAPGAKPSFPPVDPSKFKLIGHNYQTPDLVAKVTGKAKYAEDFRADGMLFAKLMLSPRPHARVVNIDASRALAMPGVHAILTADDLPPPPAPPGQGAPAAAGCWWARGRPLRLAGMRLLVLQPRRQRAPVQPAPRERRPPPPPCHPRSSSHRRRLFQRSSVWRKRRSMKASRSSRSPRTAKNWRPPPSKRFESTSNHCPL